MSSMSMDKDFVIRFSRKKMIGIISNLVFVIAILLFLYLLNQNGHGIFAVFQGFATPTIIIFMIIMLTNDIKNLRSNSPAFSGDAFSRRSDFCRRAGVPGVAIQKIAVNCIAEVVENMQHPFSISMEPGAKSPNKACT
jgi:hypothetical protein